MTSEKMYKAVRALICFSCFAGVVVPIASLLIFLYSENTEIGKILFSDMAIRIICLKILAAGFVVGAVSLFGAAVADIIGGILEEKGR